MMPLIDAVFTWDEKKCLVVEGRHWDTKLWPGVKSGRFKFPMELTCGRWKARIGANQVSRL